MSADHVVPAGSLIARLKTFDRKERGLLLRHVVGFEEQSLELGPMFRERLCDVLRGRVDKVPGNAYAAFDYDLDWLSIALGRQGNPIRPVDVRDIDLLIVIRDGGTTHVVLVEAKGDAPWDNGQLCDKAERLCEIFGKNDGTAVPGVEPHFVMISPRPPQRVRYKPWPSWMRRNGKPPWLCLTLPDGLVRVGGSVGCPTFKQVPRSRRIPADSASPRPLGRADRP